MSNTKTVCLNVGGTKYQVAKSTIENYPDTMLARLISDTWQDETETTSSKEIFVDADGHQFRYVLEYMRHQRDDLPISVSTASVLKDLEFFGFDSVSPDSIRRSETASEAARSLVSFEEAYMRERFKLEKTQEELKEALGTVVLALDFSELAYKMLRRYSIVERDPTSNGYGLRRCMHYIIKGGDPLEHYFAHRALSAEEKAIFNDCLREYGLAYTKHRPKKFILFQVTEWVIDFEEVES